MIDSHSHTSYSKHATGTVDELVRASIAAGVTILTITDHAPFPVDTDNRLLASELDRYFADIERARKIYQGQITILCGLELDYMPGTDAFNRELLTRYPMDFVIGSIHYVEIPDETMVKVWELPRLAGQTFLDRYFANLWRTGRHFPAPFRTFAGTAHPKRYCLRAQCLRPSKVEPGSCNGEGGSGLVVLSVSGIGGAAHRTRSALHGWVRYP